MEQLTRLKINKYRHIKPGTELHFNAGYNVLLGKNGTGKTTLLDLISIVISGDFSPLRGEAFDLEYDLVLPWLTSEVKISNVPELLEAETIDPLQKRPSFRWSVSADVYLNKEKLRYYLTINPEESTFRQENETKTTTRTRASIFGISPLWVEILFGSFPTELKHIDSLTRARSFFVDCWSRLCRFDESLEVFELILGRSSKKLRREMSSELAFMFEKARGGEIATRLSFYPNALEKAVREKLAKEPWIETHEFIEKQIGFLEEFAELIGATSGRVTVSLTERDEPEEGAVYKFQIARFAFRYPDGRYTPHEKLSYGQKRLLAFLYYLAANEKFVIADELTDSFHHEWIEFCMKKMEGRQCFLSSQNPILLDYLPIGSEEQAKNTFIQCRIEREGDKEWMVWRNLTPEESSGFYKDLSVGIQSISEILMFRGLW